MDKEPEVIPELVIHREPEYRVMGIVCKDKAEAKKWERRGAFLVYLGAIAFILFIVIVGIIIDQHGG